MTEVTGSGDPGSATRNSIACEPCRHKKRKCDRNLPSCRQCSHDPSKCYYPEQNKRGLPPGFTAKLEARLAETEAALFYVLSRTRGHVTPGGTENVFATPSPEGAGNQNKAERVLEWESLPLRSGGEIEDWFRWKRGTGQGRQPAFSMREDVGYHSCDPGRKSSFQNENDSSYSGVEPSPDHAHPVGSPAALRASRVSTSEVSSGRAKELSESQRNLYF